MIDQENIPLISLKALNKSFYEGQMAHHILKDVYLDIAKGNFVSIMGPSGSGKSTLINILGMLDADFQGDYLLEGSSIIQRKDHQLSQLRNKFVGFIFQDFNLIENLNVIENVELPLVYSGITSRERRQRAEDLLQFLGLGDKLKHRPSQLSGGQKQRVAIARALVHQPKFIIADEPTGALDTKTSRDIMKIISQLHQNQGVTIVMVTHDPGLQKYANQHVAIVDGIVQETSEQEVTQLINNFQQISLKDALI